MKLIILYLFFINFYAFSLMYIDKQKAIRRKWRISEKTLFLSALLGGSAGSILGMHLFHHKTKHWYFLYGMPIILILQLLLLLWLNGFYPFQKILAGV